MYFLSVIGFPENQTNDLGIASAMLYLYILIQKKWIVCY